MQESLVPYEPGPAFTPKTPPFSIRKFLRLLLKRWWILIFTVSLPVAGAIYFVKKQPTLYVSKATAWVRGKIRLGEFGGVGDGGDNFFGTQIQLLQSDRVQRQALVRLTATSPNLKQPKTPDGRFVMPRVRVSQTPKSSVLVLECTSPSAAFAKAYLDALLAEFLSYKREMRGQASSDALSAVSSQVYKHEEELKQETEKLVAFTSTNNVAALEETLRGGGNQLAQLNSQIAMLKLELQILDASARDPNESSRATNVTRSSSEQARLLSATPLHAGVGDVETVEHQLQGLLSRRDQLGKVLRPKHPKMVLLEEEISKVSKSIDFQKSRNEEQIKALREAKLLELRLRESSAKEWAARVAEANERISQLERIKAGIARVQGTYDRLLSMLQGLNLSSNLEQEDVSILEPASDARSPKTQSILTVASAGVFGVALWAGIVFLLMRMDDRCDTVIDLKAQFPEPVFGQIPELDSKTSMGLLPVIQADDQRHIFVESCRSLRSTLLFGMLDTERPRVILVTSAAPEEGKSTIALNLATTLAQGGSKVLLIDADVRRGRLHKTLGIPISKGLTECLLNNLDPSELFVDTKTPGLKLLPRGKPYSKGDLFLTASFDRFLKQVREQFDFVVLDSIPVFAADDSTTLAPKADGVLFVIRRAHTSARLAQEALEMLYQRQVKIMGIVFNRADSQSKSYNYYKYKEYQDTVAVD